jgi:hypothetical protein
MISGGLITTDRGGGRADSTAEIAALGREAAEANISVFALHLDWSFLEAIAPRRAMRLSYFRDANMAASGLERVAGMAGGAVMRVQGTSPDVAFNRVLTETSAHYLLGVETVEEERDGRTHHIQVKVMRRGAQVRSRTQVVIRKPAAKEPPARQRNSTDSPRLALKAARHRNQSPSSLAAFPPRILFFAASSSSSFSIVSSISGMLPIWCG